MSETVLSIRGLNHGHPGRPLFVDWSADFSAGVTWIVGGEGVGKTSLLRLIAGELPSGGAELRLAGVPLAPCSGRTRLEVAWCDPSTDAWDRITPTAWFDRLQAERPGFDAAQLRRHIDGFGLAPHLAKPIYQLSTGSRRKVFIAGSLAAGARVTLLDQPESALDDASRRHLRSVLADGAAAPRGRVWLVADYERPVDAAGTAQVLELGD